jgi:hypothetical protein
MSAKSSEISRVRFTLYRQAVCQAPSMSVAPYGYTHSRGIPSTVNAILFMLGAVGGFALVGVVSILRQADCSHTGRGAGTVTLGGFSRALDRGRDRKRDPDRTLARGSRRVATRWLCRHHELPRLAGGTARSSDLDESHPVAADLPNTAPNWGRPSDRDVEGIVTYMAESVVPKMTRAGQDGTRSRVKNPRASGGSRQPVDEPNAGQDIESSKTEPKADGVTSKCRQRRDRQPNPHREST